MLCDENGGIRSYQIREIEFDFATCFDEIDRREIIQIMNQNQDQYKAIILSGNEMNDTI